MTQREAVWVREAACCCGCDCRLKRGAGSWAWQAHHVIKAQTLRRRGVRPARIRDATFVVLLCRRCHERQEGRTLPVPLERLPAAVVAAVDALGTWAEDLLRRYHPPSGAGAAPRLNEGSRSG